jgi:hypothetical protein
MKLPGATREFEVSACVQWSVAGVGMGFRFDAPSPEEQATIAEFVDAHFFRSRKV